MAKVKRIEIENRKARFNYHIEETYEAGISLTGSEVKSIRAQKVNLGESYAFIENGELKIRGMHISEYENAGYSGHEPTRERVLLLNRRELDRIDSRIKTKGYAVFPIRLYENDRGFFKLEMGLGTGKKTFDKREDLKAKDIERDLRRQN